MKPLRQLTGKQAESLGYSPARVLPSGETAGVMRMLYTTGLFVGITRHFWRTRFCYETTTDAVAALQTWDGYGDPPGPWIKEKGGVERSNPSVGKP
jgi:hypothetical protein